MKNIIHAISFLHKGERVIVKATNFGKFKVPVTEVTNGQLNTKMRNLTAKQVIDHDIIKNCDPTFYLDNNERLRVYPAGDSSYLPAQADGLALKHDAMNKTSVTKLKKKVVDKSATSGYNSYQQAGLDMYGWWPEDFNDGNAD
tara:strand:- start:2369 stop:2797 length:429 start_codon:yes stop_codon:yes gene_type:complete